MTQFLRQVVIAVIGCICWLSIVNASAGSAEEISSEERSAGSKPRIQLAFGIMTYQRDDRTVDETYAEFLRLMVNIYGGEDKHIYILHTDVKSDPSLLHAINNDYCAPKANCRHIESRNIAWGSLTTGEMMLSLMRKADTFFNDGGRVTPGHAWDYFVLLGHESFPLTSLTYAENFLASFPRSAVFLF
jgi:hypothetical protein